MPPIEGFQTSAPPPAVGGQALLKRRPGMTSEAFKAYYIEHHARLAMPWCLDNGVVSYVQVRLYMSTHR